MEVRIRMHGSLGRHHAEDSTNSGNGIAITFPQKEISMAHIFSRLRIPEESVGFVAVNGVRTAKDTVVTDGDEIAIFPMVTGG